MKSIEVTAKKVNDAIEQGLKELGLTLDAVNVEVLDTGGLFRKAKVRLTVDEPEQNAETEKDEKTEKPSKPATSAKSDVKSAEPKAAADDKLAQKPKKDDKAGAVKPAEPKAKVVDDKKPAKPIEKDRAEKQKAKEPTAPKKQAEKPKNVETKRSERREEDAAAFAGACEFVKELIAKMGFEAQVAPKADDPDMIEITAPQGDDSLIIGRHGETLSAIQYLAETGARAEKHHINIAVDCNGYRDRRAASLSAMARRKADECVRRNRKIKLEPMERIDRRTVHYALGDDDRVTTASEGKEPYRCIVIAPKK